MKDFKIISLKDEGIIYECLVCGDRFTDKSVKHLRTWHKHKPMYQMLETKFSNHNHIIHKTMKNEEYCNFHSFMGSEEESKNCADCTRKRYEKEI